MKTEYAPGLHDAAGREANAAAYEGWVGRWSRLFGPTVLAAAEVATGQQILDVSTGTGEAASMMLPIVGGSGLVVGVDIAPAMLRSARLRLGKASFCSVAADGQALPFRNESFDAVACQLSLQFYPDPQRGLIEFKRVLRPGCCAAVCVISSPDRAPMWGVLGDVLSRFVPEKRELLHLSFALADTTRLQSLFADAGFRETRVERIQRDGAVESFDEYWNPIEAGMGSMPQVYLDLSEEERLLVREEVRARLSRFEAGGRLMMSVEMLIATGRA
jgi:ubiquinone/menaquinone biosynthesis C-methylase UbiE